MPKFIVQNHTRRQQVLAIEPWAEVERLEPDDVVRFDYDEPGTVEFVVVEDNFAHVAVWVMSDRCTITTKQGSRTWKTPERPD